VPVPLGGTRRSRTDPGRRSVTVVIEHAGYEVVLLRHGETVGYDGDLGLTPLGERQAYERGAALAKEVAPGTDVRMPHAQTERATATAQALRAALVDELAGLKDGTTVGPLYGEPDLTNLRFALHEDVVDTSVAVTTRLRLPEDTLPDWAREFDRFDSEYRAIAARGGPIEYWLRNPTLWFEPPQLAALRLWRAVATFGAQAGHRPLLVVATSHSGPMRALVATAVGRDSGEPDNLEDVRVRVDGDGAATLTFRDIVVPFEAVPTLPPWFG
jgi:broad specificity phosphatase PhoE